MIQAFKSINASKYPKIKVTVSKKPLRLNVFFIENEIKITNQTLNNILKMILMLSKTVSFNSKCIELKNKKRSKK